MKRGKRRIYLPVLAGLTLVLGFLLSLEHRSGKGTSIGIAAGKGGEASMKIVEHIREKPIPPLDREAPSVIEVATFALG